MSTRPKARTVIVTRTKDRPLLLKRAVDSVLSQDDDNWCQVIINDGGDPAAVRAVVSPRADAYGDRLHILDNPTSLGMEAASNRAIDESRSDYLVIHDDDDAWDPGFLSTCVAFLEARNHYGGVCTRTRMVRERIEGDTVVRDGDEPFLYDVKAVTLARVLRSNCMTPISFLYRRSCLEAIGPYRADLPVLGDWEFNVRFLRRFDVGLIDQPLAFYHVRPPSTGPMANSIHGVFGHHREVEAMLRNGWLREALNQDSSLIGLLGNTAEAMPADVIVDMLWADVERQSHQIHMLDALFKRQMADQERKDYQVRMLDTLVRGQLEDQERKDYQVSMLDALVRGQLAMQETLTQELRARDAHIQQLTAQLQGVTSSTSWKVSAPVRWFGRLFRRGGRTDVPDAESTPSAPAAPPAAASSAPVAGPRPTMPPACAVESPPQDTAHADRPSPHPS